MSKPYLYPKNPRVPRFVQIKYLFAFSSAISDTLFWARDFWIRILNQRYQKLAGLHFYKIKNPNTRISTHIHYYIHTIVLYRVVLYLVETNLVETKACPKTPEYLFQLNCRQAKIYGLKKPKSAFTWLIIRWTSLVYSFFLGHRM